MPHSPYRDRVIPPSVPHLRVIVTGVLLAVLLTLTACTSTADPAPTPTATPLFASKKEAFAAAEKTMNRYIQALNAVDTTDPRTFEPLFQLSSGALENTDRKNFSAMHADRQVLSGSTHLRSFRGLRARSPFAAVTAEVCLDVSEVQILNADGSSGVSPSRPDVYGLEVEFVAHRKRPYTIDRATPTERVPC